MRGNLHLYNQNAVLNVWVEMNIQKFSTSGFIFERDETFDFYNFLIRYMTTSVWEAMWGWQKFIFAVIANSLAFQVFPYFKGYE